MQIRQDSINTPNSNKLLTLEDYNEIKNLYSEFNLAYKYIHNKKIYNSPDELTIHKIIKSVYIKINGKLPENYLLSTLINELRSLSENFYFRAAARSVSYELSLQNKSLDCYAEINKIIKSLIEIKQQFNQIFNREDIIKEAYKIYKKNNWSSDIQSIKEERFAEQAWIKSQKRVIENIMKKNPELAEEILNPQKKKSTTPEITPTPNKIDSEQLKLNRLRYSIWKLENKIRERFQDIWHRIIIQIDNLIDISIKGGEDIIINWEKKPDIRYNSFTWSTQNNQAAISYLQKFIRGEKQNQSIISSNMKYLFFDKENPKNSLKPEDINDDFAKLYISKVQLKQKQQNT